MSYIEATIFCPYYKDSNEVCIFCEGVERGSKTRLGFSNKGQRNDYIRRHCSRVNPGCIYADALDRKYGVRR